MSRRDFDLAIIEEYRRHRCCLWQVIDDEYHNKDKSNAALERLLFLLKEKDPNSNLDTVKKKIASLRNCFKKEYNKITMVRNYIRKTDRGMTYSREKLSEAVEKVRSGELNGYEAAQIYKIPRTTLYDYIKGKSKKSSTLGKPPALAPELEKVIADNLLALEENGFYLGRKEILDLVGLYLKEHKIRHPFKAGKPGECWLSSFSKRRSVSAKPIYKEFVNPDKEVLMVKGFYSILEMKIQKLELAEKPGQIWHIEEHSFSKGKRVNNYDKDRDITIVTVCSAEGRKAPMLSVIKGEASHDWMLGKHIKVSHKKGMCREVFKHYFTTIFLNYIDDSKENLVIFEGQTAFIDLDVIEEARKVKVTIVKAPSYLESLDISIARTLKAKWDQVFGDCVEEFATVMSQLFDDLQETAIGLDFKNAGVHPFEAVCDSKFSSDRLKIYEEYSWFRERHLENMKQNRDTEQVMVREPELQMDFEMELDSSSSMCMTDEGDTPNRCSGDLLQRALLSVKRGLKQHEDMHHSKDLTKAEEDHIAAWFMDLNNAGFNITEDNLMDAVCSARGQRYSKPDRHKYENFIKGHPKLKHKLSKDVSVKVTSESINLWLYHTRMYLKKRNVGDVLSHPKRIFNLGEIVLNYNVEDKDKEINTDGDDSLTVYVAASADGRIQTPSVIFPLKPIGSNAWSKAEILNDEITDVFYDWLTEHNIEFPVVLFLDQMTHVNLSLFEFCKEKQIVLLALPNTQIQPLEAIFEPLNKFWNENFAIKKLKKEELAKVLENYVTQDFSREIKKRFKVCGIYPYNANIKYSTKETANSLNNTEKITQPKTILNTEKSEELNKINVLEEVEKRISTELLEEFTKSGDSWAGDPRHFSLFLFWKNLREENKSENINFVIDVDIKEERDPEERDPEERDPEEKDPESLEPEDETDMFVEIFVDEVNTSVSVCKGSDVLM